MSSAKNNNNLYSDLPNRIDTILGEDTHLHKLKQLSLARNAWMAEFGQEPKLPLDTWSFAMWLHDRWGIELRYNSESMGLAGYNVVDKQKYLLFCMVFP